MSYYRFAEIAIALSFGLSFALVGWWDIVPRRSITGRLVFGPVWRRRDGRRWIYKKFTEYAQDRAR
jgi:hypothetical protein